jgi:hypothetical protein
MYISNEGGKITVSMVKKYLAENKVKVSAYDSPCDIVKLNDALLSMRKSQERHKYVKKVFASCDKEPRNLDSGKHYFSLYFVDKSGGVNRFWFTPFMDVQNRDESIPKYGFSSGVIGMSRLFDATDGIFIHLRNIGGVYAQIDGCH